MVILHYLSITANCCQCIRQFILVKKDAEFLVLPCGQRLQHKNYVSVISCVSLSSTVYITIAIWTTRNFRDCKILQILGYFLLGIKLGSFSLTKLTYTNTNAIYFGWRSNKQYVSNGMGTFLKRVKRKYSHYSKHIKGFKLQSIQLLETVVPSSKSSQISFDWNILSTSLENYFRQ